MFISLGVPQVFVLDDGVAMWHDSRFKYSTALPAAVLHLREQLEYGSVGITWNVSGDRGTVHWMLLSWVNLAENI